MSENFLTCVKAVQLGELLRQAEVASGRPQLVHRIGSAGEQDLLAELDEVATDSGGKTSLAVAGGAEDEKIGTLVKPGVGGGQGQQAAAFPGSAAIVPEWRN